ncbi:ATP-binding domain-containing protein [Gottschalkia acidurici 9a]|uniref:ATP-binding domain-containing protein n=1 Tax=Gottschalkia acidurici (strain ATCC 7906 / DSM 604 / BCRC 14475 / CIP 104303 / KCTC 5404 / NCIMB 10678 / 9a) TaxID=1128398 RepID=K0B0A6_GOTA9|nr:ATP-binding protein [Gottschalkia acidurici]AFS78959.1 ATP-binding domain-containing protein [Gottschalkia acidurici 9a]
MKKYIYLALNYFKSEKDRVIISILGISLAVAIVFGLDVIGESQSRGQLENVYKIYGSFHGAYINLDKEKVKEIKLDKDIDKSVEIANLGQAIYDNGVSLSLNSVDKYYINMNEYILKKGHIPKKHGELILESQTLKKMGLKEELNQIINFKIKKEYKDENNINQIFVEDKEFKLVGIIDKPSDYYKEYHIFKGFTFFEEGETKIIPDNLIKYETYVKLKTNINHKEKLDQIRERYNIERSNYNGDNHLIGALDDYYAAQNGENYVYIKTLVIITVTLLLSIIFNSLINNIIQDKETLKLSNKDVDVIILIQSLMIMTLGIILGTILGATFAHYGVEMFGYVSTSILLDVKGDIYISLKTITRSIKVGTLMTIVSSVVQLLLLKSKVLRKLDKIFNINRKINYKNSIKNKIISIITVLSISIGGMVYIEHISSINDSILDDISPRLLSMEDNDFILDYDYYFNIDTNFTGYTDEDIKNISNIDGVSEVDSVIKIYGFLKSNIRDIEDEYIKDIGVSNGSENIETHIQIKGYDDGKLKKLEKYIDSKSILDETLDKYPSVIAYNYYYDGLNNYKIKKVRKNLKVGDIITVKMPIVKEGKLTYTDYKVRVGALLKKEWSIKGDNGIGTMPEIIIPKSKLIDMTGRNEYRTVNIRVEKGKEDYVYKKLNKIIKNKPFSTIKSKIEHIQKSKSLSKENKKRYGIIISILLFIAGLNIFNTIRTKLLINTNMKFNKIKNIILKEAIVYGILGSIASAILGSYKIYIFIKMVIKQYKNDFGMPNIVKYRLPIIEILEFSAISITLCTLAAFGAILLFYIIERKIKVEVEKQKILFIENQLKIQKEYYKELYSSQNEIRRIKHDINANLLAIHGYLEKNDLESAKNYILELTGEVKSIKNYFDTGIASLDSILNSKCKRIKEINSKLDYKLAISKEIVIDHIDISILLSNAIDNAIEATEKISETNSNRTIIVKLSTVQEYISIVIINPVYENIDVNFLETTKIDKTYHGYGLSTIRNIVNKYDGDLDISCANKFFKLSVLLKNKSID